ncbi:MAG: efflux RND transporter periplasmic adaptor subunit [Anaeromyxobacter sp.]
MSRRLRLLPALAASFTLFACTKAAGPAAPPPASVVVAPVVQKDIDVASELVGQLRGLQDIEIRARVEGFLASIDYVEGGEVKAGQLLFTIDPRELTSKVASARADVARAESNLSKAEMDVKRYGPLVAQRAVAQAELDNAQAAQRAAVAQLEAARATLEKSQLDLSYARVVSPVSGLASKAEKQVGSLVGRGESTLLATVSSLDPIRVSVALPETDYLRLVRQVGERGTANRNPKAPAPEDGPELILADGRVHTARGKVILVDNAVDPTTGTIRVDLAFANPDRTLRPGLYGKVRFRSERRAGALLVPQRAVTELQGTFSVAVVTAENAVEMRKTKMGPRMGEDWVVEEGLKPGERVVVEGIQKVRNGSQVAVREAGAPAVVPAAAEGK